MLGIYQQCIFPLSRLDNKIAACSDANNYLCAASGAKNQSVNINYCLFTQKSRDRVNIDGSIAGCASRNK